MHINASFDYAVLRVVPRVEREEFVNAGVLLYCQERRYLQCVVQMDEARLLALEPSVDVEMVRQLLHAAALICRGDADAGPIAALSQRERFYWLTAPRSTVLQASPVRTGVCPKDADGCGDLDARLREIAALMLRGPGDV